MLPLRAGSYLGGFPYSFFAFASLNLVRRCATYLFVGAFVGRFRDPMNDPHVRTSFIFDMDGLTTAIQRILNVAVSRNFSIGCSPPLRVGSMMEPLPRLHLHLRTCRKRERTPCLRRAMLLIRLKRP